MSLIDSLSLIVLGLTTGALFLRRSRLVKAIQYLTPLLACVIFLLLLFDAYQQFSLWQHDPFSQYLLPPHQSVTYFLGYVGIRFFSPFFIALLGAILIPGVAEILNRRYGERFFEEEEFSYMQLGIFLTGYPGFLFYIVFVLLLGIILSAFYSLRGKGRAPFYYLWLPCALFAIIIRIWFFSDFFLAQFNL